MRGGTAVAAIADEIAFWRSDESRNPDVEILNAARPSLATTGGMLACISSPYSRRGELWETFRRDYGPDGDSKILVAKAPSLTMNATLNPKVVERAYERDPAVASAEYGGEFRSDVESFLTREIVEPCVVPGIAELPPETWRDYFAFVDPSGGRNDSFTMAIAHREREMIVVDHISEQKPPFSPDEVVARFCGVLNRYGVSFVVGDRYGGEWPREAFRNHGVQYNVAEKSRSDLYLSLLPKLMSRSVWLLSHERLITQLVGLERRTGRTGRDSIDHTPGSHDDIANAVAGAIDCAAESINRPMLVFG